MRKGLGLIDLSVTDDATGMKGGVALKRESADISYRVGLWVFGGELCSDSGLVSTIGVSSSSS